MANPPYKTPPCRPLSASLLSPPETKPSESFHSANYTLFPFEMPDMSTNHRNRLRIDSLLNRDGAYASPPISPFDTQARRKSSGTIETQQVRDPPLFTPGDATEVANVPLFPNPPSEAASQDVITEYMRSDAYTNLKVRPTREEYETILTFRATVFEQAFKNTKKWWARERSFDKIYDHARSRVQKPVPVPRRNLAPPPASRSRQPKVPVDRVASQSTRSPRVQRAPKRTPKAQVYNSFDDASLIETPKRPRIITKDVDYNALPDFCPPPSTVTDENKGPFLRVEWKGKPLTVHDDAELMNLPPHELRLACTLRLTYASYMCTKRRIFMAFVDHLKRGKEFCKTNAQDACKVDVNKASKLWEAYNAVGWFDRKQFAQFV